jgi:hypothetical protein
MCAEGVAFEGQCEVLRGLLVCACVLVCCDGRYNKYTESKPAVFHFNGGGKKLHLPMESRVWYKKPEFKATDNTEAVLDSELEMGGEMRRLRDVCPPHVYQIGS